MNCFGNTIGEEFFKNINPMNYMTAKRKKNDEEVESLRAASTLKNHSKIKVPDFESNFGVRPASVIEEETKVFVSKEQARAEKEKAEQEIAN